MVFLQTSCSKEHTNNQTEEAVKKTAPVALTRDHQAVLDFKEQFDYYSAGSSYSYNTLTLEDAEWILEAAFNYEHMFLDFNLTDYEIGYSTANTLPLPTDQSGGLPVVLSSVLFNIYSDLLTIPVDSTIAPMTDIWIDLDESGDRRVSVSLATFKPTEFNNRRAYSGDYLAFDCNPHIKTHHWCSAGSVNSCFPTQSPGWAWEILDYNLRFDHANPYLITSGNSGYYTSINKHTYGSDPFVWSSYVGPQGQDYSLKLHGTNQTINANSLADGYYNQCINNAQIQLYDQWMTQIINDHINSTIEVFDVKVEAKESDNFNGTIQNWTHHIFTFRTGVLKP